ncbi:MAG: VOC family protein [Labilithrix sp.]|nr:VOC family protein [Labilithrix sp.]MCW5818252.1 VOC family protein [Labilithrix sp.]
MIKSATPYLFFFGKANEAIGHYERALGAKAKTKQTFGAMAKEGSTWADKIMHCELEVGEALILLSDGRPHPGVAPTNASMSVALQLDDEAEARRAFDVLAEGGNVHEKLFDAPWGGIFGVVEDRYGINWMFTAPKNAK